MGNTVLQPKELLGVLLLKTTASRNKMLRMKWSYEGECFKIIEDTPFGLARNISSDLRCDGEDARKYRVIRQQKILSPIEKMKLAK